MTPLVKAARHIALGAHENLYYPPHAPPIAFAAHLSNVVGVGLRYGFEDDEVVIAGCWLHDILEDTPMTAEELFNELRMAGRLFEEAEPPGREPHLFSDAMRIVDVVRACTDEPGENRVERKRKTYPKIVKVGDSAVAVKLCDRIANVEASVLGMSGPHEGRAVHYFEVYQSEHEEFLRALSLGRGKTYTELRMWDYLGNLLVNGGRHGARHA